MTKETYEPLLTAPPRRSKFTVLCLDVPIDLIDEDPDNARDHPEDNLNDIAASLDEYGLQKPISIMPTGDGRFRCLAGNGTLRTARRMGAEVITASISDLEGDHAEGFTIADNQAGASSVWNFDRLGAKMARLKLAGFPLRATCWRAPAIDELIRSRLPSPVAPPSLTTTPPALASPANVGSRDVADDEDADQSTTSPATPAPAQPQVDGQAQHFQHWRTSPTTLALVSEICGVTEWDLDTASNEHSIVPCRVSLHGGPEAIPTRECSRGAAKPGGRVQVRACGLREHWPTRAVCWWNPPYNDIPTWLMQVLWHASRGGRGAGIIPGNLLETAWGQALLLARHDIDLALRQLVDVSGACAARDKVDTLLGEDRQGELPIDPDATVRVFMLRGRAAFMDHRRPDPMTPVKNNNGGSVLVFWGHARLSTQVQPSHGVWL